AFAAGTFGQERFVRPVDQAPNDASFLAFRTKLIAAAESRDAKFILSIIDPKIELSFGGDAGLADFKRIWKLNAAKSPFWEVFLPAIRNGGRFDRDPESRQMIFAAPYTFDGFPEDLDVFEYQAIFGSDVNLRSTPNADAPVAARLSYNIVRVDHDRSVKRKGSDEEFEWYRVETLGGLKGFVKSEFVRSPIDYRAGFQKKRGVWKMIFFIAGD
ncbi:MAG: SH3 domain-containing protein, partial [Acidobacteriota bacterium]